MLVTFYSNPAKYDDKLRLTTEEVDALRETLPVPSIHEWNGASYDGVSFVVPAEWHPTVRASMTTNYQRCPTTGTDRCPGNRSPVFCECAERRRGYDLASKPEGWQ